MEFIMIMKKVQIERIPFSIEIMISIDFANANVKFPYQIRHSMKYETL